MNVNITGAPALRTTGAWAVLVAALLVLAGCGDLPLARDSTEFLAEEARAQRLAEEARPLEAARAYEYLATEGPTGERVRMASLAAAQYLAAGRTDDARRLLPPSEQVTSREQRLVWAPVAARLALAGDQPDEALRALAVLPEDLPRALRREVLALEAESQFALGDPARGVVALMQRRDWLEPGDEALLANERLIWSGLQSSGSAVFAAARERYADRELAGWLALGTVAVNAARNPFGVAAAMSSWRQDHPRHPANDALVDEVLAGYRSLMDYPRRIALVLPLSGRQQGVGLAVRDGFMAAYFEHSGEGKASSVEVYDSAAGLVEAYREAVQDGADFIIGPLLREEVEAVVPLAGQVPTLALNQLADNVQAPANLFQFALAPEDEAAQVARVASQRHGGRAVALVPNDEWGQRMLASFSEALRAQGGQLLDYAAYDTWEQDFSTPITRMLQLDGSQERHRSLAQALGTRLEFQPRRRQDADFIFLAARNAQARLIRPQLRYFFAGNLPTYAPSAVYQPGGGSEGDLNGIIFPDAPWLLDPDEGMQSLKTQIEGFWPGRGDRLGRLYAMGFDAYRLVPLLFEATAGHDSAEIDGMSGRLRLERDGRIHRTLAWAQFRSGRPVAFALPPVEVYQEDEPVDMVPAVIGSRQ